MSAKNDLRRYLNRFKTGVLTVQDEDGSPISIRIRALWDASKRCARIDSDALPLAQGKASLLFHRHNRILWNLTTILITGSLEREGSGWIFKPKRTIKGTSTLSVPVMIRQLKSARRSARRYLMTHQMDRPKIPWHKMSSPRGDR